jgi:hypothetical protein
VTVVGHAATIAAGEWITASGEWINDRTHGQQGGCRARSGRHCAALCHDAGSDVSGSGAAASVKSATRRMNSGSSDMSEWCARSSW